jgi:hypothetical protein
MLRRQSGHEVIGHRVGKGGYLTIIDKRSPDGRPKTLHVTTDFQS